MILGWCVFHVYSCGERLFFCFSKHGFVMRSDFKLNWSQLLLNIFCDWIQCWSSIAAIQKVIAKQISFKWTELYGTSQTSLFFPRQVFNKLEPPVLRPMPSGLQLRLPCPQWWGSSPSSPSAAEIHGLDPGPQCTHLWLFSKLRTQLVDEFIWFMTMTPHPKKKCRITTVIKSFSQIVVLPTSSTSNSSRTSPILANIRRCHCYPFLVPLLPCSPFRTPAIATASSGHGFAQSVKLMDLSWGTSSRAVSRPRFDVLLRGENIRDIMRYQIFITWCK